MGAASAVNVSAGADLQSDWRGSARLGTDQLGR